jgi:hypothetical protein
LVTRNKYADSLYGNVEVIEERSTDKVIDTKSASKEQSLLSFFSFTSKPRQMLLTSTWFNFTTPFLDNPQKKA